MKYLTAIVLSFFLCFLGQAQQNEAKILTLDDAVNMALSNHPLSKNATLKVEAAKIRESGSILLDPTDVLWEHGQIYSPIYDNRITISQNLGSPFTHVQQNKLHKGQLELSQTQQKISQKQLICAVKEAYFKWVHQLSIDNLLLQEADLYEEFFNLAKLHFEFGDSNLLAKVMAETRYSESQRKLLISQEETKISVNFLNRLIYSEEPYQPSQLELELYTVKFPKGQEDKFYPFTFREYFQQQVNQKKIELSLEKSHFFPEISAGYFRHSINPVKNLQGFQIGLSVPLWFLPTVSKVKEAKINSDIAQNEATLRTYELEQTIDDLKIRLDQEFINVIYYRENALTQADLLLKYAIQKLHKQEINYTEYLQSVTEALRIKTEYLNSLLKYNITAVELEYYLN